VINDQEFRRFMSRVAFPPASGSNLTPLQQALLVVRETQAKLEALRRAQAEPIAIVGIACRLPGGVRDPKTFWNLMRNKVDAITDVPTDRWDVDAYYDADPLAPGKMNTRSGGFLDRVREFDAAFFDISPQEAARMDPQQRHLLELAWEALEDAGLPPQELRGKLVGVFVGISFSEYGMLLNAGPTAGDPLLPTGSSLSIAANRLSYTFDFRGPSVAIDTACSSSLVAVHQACQSLRAGESTVALAGGVNLILSPNINVNLSKGGFLAPDGRCRTFDAKASGYVRGEGAGVVVLKPLSAAQASGDSIYAVIRGSAVNQDGASSGLTAPNRQAQEDVLREAYARARVSPSQVRYIETHGTGTPLGDPIEARAIGAVVAEGRPAHRPCHLGALKANIGHAEAAAGVAGLIKVALCLTHRELPPTVHFAAGNPNIPFAELPIRIQQELGPWPDGDGPLVAGVSSFGFGGTNSHAVLEEAPAVSADAADAAPRARLLPISARSADALDAAARRLRDLLAARPLDATGLRDVVYSAARRRDHHDHRLAIVGAASADFVAGLDDFLEGKSRPGVATGWKAPGRRSRLAFVFSGQGPQWWGMGRGLFATEPVFRAVVERFSDALKTAGADGSLLDEFQAPEADSRIGRTEVAQPALVALQLALAALWKSWGIEPQAVVGHSLGEVSAACVAGALTLEEAARVIHHRGRLTRQVAGKGRTAAVELPVDAVRQELQGSDGIGVAAVNGPSSTTISGDAPAMEALVARLKERGIPATLLQVDCAFHSAHLDGARQEMERLFADLRPKPASVPFFSTVAGQALDGTALDGRYWGRNLREPVLFAAAIGQLAERHHDLFLEVGPHPVLAGAIGQSARAVGKEAVIAHSLRRREDDTIVIRRALGELYARGWNPDWKAVEPAGRFTRLPTYPWQRETFWLESAKPATAARPASGHPLLGDHVVLARPANAHLWQAEADAATIRGLDHYEVDGAVMVPGTSFLDLVSAAVREAFPGLDAESTDLECPNALFLSEPGRASVQTILTPDGPGRALFEVYSRPIAAGADEPWTLHAAGQLRLEPRRP
jgi:myxalamid-type polyketide synthase MxaE and MxaD